MRYWITHGIITAGGLTHKNEGGQRNITNMTKILMSVCVWVGVWPLSLLCNVSQSIHIGYMLTRVISFAYTVSSGQRVDDDDMNRWRGRDTHLTLMLTYIITLHVLVHPPCHACMLFAWLINLYGKHTDTDTHTPNTCPRAACKRAK